MSSLDETLRALLEERKGKGRFRSVKEYETGAGSSSSAQSSGTEKGKGRAPLLDFVCRTVPWNGLGSR